MATQYSALVLSDIVMHQIRKATDGSAARFETVLTDEPVTMTPPDQDFLTRRLVRVLSGRGIPIIEDSAVTSPMPSAVRSTWKPHEDYIALTKTMAEHLAAAQKGNALEGLLVVARASLQGDDLLIVAKVEHQEAMRLEAVVNSAGHNVFNIERLQDLVFGDAAKIYKVGILSRSQSASGVLSGEIVDEQNGLGFAAYFLQRYLGMKLREEPAVLTERFLTGMSAVINATTLPPETRMEVQSALASELRSNSTSVTPMAFIRTHVPQGFQSEVTTLASERDVPLMQFAKDASRVQSRLTRIRLDLSNDVHIIAPADEVGEGKAVSVTAEGVEDVVTVRGGRLNNVKANGSR